MIDLFSRLFADRLAEDKFIAYLRQAQSDMETLKEWANQATAEIAALKKRIDTLEDEADPVIVRH